MKMVEKRTCKIDKRWETTLLRRSEPVQFPNIYSAALRRLNYVEHKMGRDSNFKMQYSQRVQYYLENGYERILHDDEAKECSPKTWFLPYFGTVHPNKPGKVRIVFDTAAKVDGISLNSMLLTGPVLLTSLPRVLIKFRQRRIAFTGEDILRCEARPTKRQILRLMILILDPLGFLRFFVWKSKNAWDDELGTELFKIWEKWKNVQPEVKVGAIVLVTDPGQPRSSWPLGKIVTTFLGEDEELQTSRLRLEPIGPLWLSWQFLMSAREVPPLGWNLGGSMLQRRLKRNRIRHIFMQMNITFCFV
ncbi:unnamed protein product [Orchesella dallaii]|uniref:DUF5641 domain-containing protein n=1 Tax=Orchesella dallaii TaxID=48710 RepID=A0ABP1PLY9_9HEXA